MRRTFAVLTGLAVLALTGCGGGGVVVTGNVTKGGKTFNPTDQERVNISLAQESGTVSASGSVADDGTFKIIGADGTGLPPGKYKVTVAVYSASTDPKKGSKPVAAQLPETWDVGGTTAFTVDLDKLPKEKEKPKAK